MIQKKLQAKIKELSLRYNVPQEVVIAAFKSQFECAREEAQKGEQGEPDTFVNIRFKHLGLLLAKLNKIMAIHNAKNRNKTRDSGD